MRRPGQATRVAIVDDDEAVRNAVKRLLVVSGLQVETFASGQEFLDALAPDRFDCALVDLNMPGMAGLEVLAHMRNGGTGVPPIIVTAYDDPLMKAQCLAFGARAYLRKPLDRQRLLDAIAHAIVPGAHWEGLMGEL